MLSAKPELFVEDKIIQQRRDAGQQETLEHLRDNWQERDRPIGFRKHARLAGFRNHNDIGSFPQAGKLLLSLIHI